MKPTPKQKRGMLSLGYRRMNNSELYWGKPVGSSLLIIDFKGEEVVWSNRFIAMNDEILVWETRIFDKKDLNRFKEYISYYETYTRYDVGKKNVDMSFLTIEDSMDL